MWVHICLSLFYFGLTAVFMLHYVRQLGPYEKENVRIKHLIISSQYIRHWFSLSASFLPLLWPFTYFLPFPSLLPSPSLFLPLPLPSFPLHLYIIYPSPSLSSLPSLILPPYPFSPSLFPPSLPPPPLFTPPLPSPTSVPSSSLPLSLLPPSAVQQQCDGGRNTFSSPKRRHFKVLAVSSVARPTSFACLFIYRIHLQRGNA